MTEHCNRCGVVLARVNKRGLDTFCCQCADWWDNREHRPGGIKRKPWMN